MLIIAFIGDYFNTGINDFEKNINFTLARIYTPMSKTFILPKVKPKIEINAKTLKQLKVQEEQQVIIHGSIADFPNGYIRIWQTTFLIPKGSTNQCKLLHAENIAIYPSWSRLGKKGESNFTLIFEGLPADCTVFDLIEVIPESGGFEVRDILRNDHDVYRVSFS